MDLKLVALFVFAACASTAYGDKVECYKCDITLADGDRQDGDSYCRTGERAIARGRTKRCKHGCLKIELAADVELLGVELEYEYIQRGCDEIKERNTCEDENDQPLYAALFESIIDSAFDDYNNFEMTLCFCETALCNTATNVKIGSLGFLLSAFIAMFLYV